jgi:putative membrane protein
MNADKITIEQNKEPYKKLIITLSVAIPLAVAALFGIPKIKGYDFTFLPPIYASINGLTAILLVAAVIAIKNGQRNLHETLMKVCMALSAGFLIMYVIYHTTTERTNYGGEGVVAMIYYFILFTHILLSIVVIPFVLFTFSRALSGNFGKHRALAKYTFPLWLYVAITGVIVYFMISPYYK